MAWTIKYSDTAKVQLRKLDKPIARRILDFMDERIADLENPRSSGKALNLAIEKFGPHLALSGSDDFKRRAKDIAQQQGLSIKIDGQDVRPVWTPRGYDPFR